MHCSLGKTIYENKIDKSYLEMEKVGTHLFCFFESLCYIWLQQSRGWL